MPSGGEQDWGGSEGVRAARRNGLVPAIVAAAGPIRTMSVAEARGQWPWVPDRPFFDGIPMSEVELNSGE